MTIYKRRIEQKQKTFCPKCGFGVPVSANGFCEICASKAIGEAVDRLYANRFTFDLNVHCDDCGEEIEFEESHSCTGCGAVLCNECLHLDVEGEQFCTTCWDGMLEEEENSEVKNAIDDEFSTSKEKEEAPHE
jgi:hypothetical protein